MTTQEHKKLLEQIAGYINHGLSDEEVVLYLRAAHGMNSMESKFVGIIRDLLSQKRYQVTVTQIVSDEELHREDRADNPSGEHSILAEDAEDALDRFHTMVPISDLSSFEIEAKEEEDPVHTEQRALVAAMIMLLDSKIFTWLEGNDPTMLQLARETVKASFLGKM